MNNHAKIAATNIKNIQNAKNNEYGTGFTHGVVACLGFFAIVVIILSIINIAA